MTATPARDGAELIAAERRRQIDEEGWTPEHDAEHVANELVVAAMAYADAALMPGIPVQDPSDYWPWHLDWWKPSADPVRNLVKAGALIAAEIDRLRGGGR